MIAEARYSFSLLKKELQASAVESHFLKDSLLFSHASRELTLHVSAALVTETENSLFLPLDYLIVAPHKVAAFVRSRMGLNRIVFARQCRVQPLDKPSTRQFLDQNHLMGATQSAYNLGLFYQQELLAVATFSKGRKMNRLPADVRSFELIRFCCKSGYTITGGLSRLIKNFVSDKHPGDIMTYIDKQLHDGTSFIKAGFKKSGETSPNHFLVDRSNFERLPYKEEAGFDASRFYMTSNLGNIKLIYTPGEQA